MAADTPVDTAESPAEQWSHYSTLVFVLLAAIIFLLTSAPGIGTEDSAELAGGGRFLAMVHAPGYPLYLLLGRIASAFAAYPGRGMVLLSAWAGAIAVGIVHTAAKRAWGEGSAGVAAATLMVCRGFWDAATMVEVYTIQAVLIGSLLAILLHLRSAPSGRGLRLFGLVLGLTLAHHVGVIILLPFLLGFLAWTVRPFPTRALPAALGYLAAGIALYAVPPLLSHRPGIPVIWWEPVQSAGELVYRMSGAGFKKLLFAVPLPKVIENLRTLPFVMLGWNSIVGTLLVLVGAWGLAREDRPLLFLLGGIIVTTLFHVANYAVLDPESFLLPAVAPLALTAAYGYRWLHSRRPMSVGTQSFIVTLLVILGVLGRASDGRLMGPAFDSLPADIARATLSSHDRAAAPDGDSSTATPANETVILWADWHLFPTLRYFQIAEGLGPNVLVELDSTSETPGLAYLAGRTYAARPSRTLGESYALVMTGLHWRVDTALTLPITDTRVSGEPLLAVEGLELVGVRTPGSVRVGEPIPVEILVRRGTDPISDSAIGALILLRNGRPLLKTPFAPVAWHLPPTRMTVGQIYSEPVQTIIPSAYAWAPETDTFSLAVELASGAKDSYVEIGILKIRKD